MIMPDTLLQLLQKGVRWPCAVKPSTAAAVMEGVTVGQVFDAECILSKRSRKVNGQRRTVFPREPVPPVLTLCVSAGKVRVSGEVEGLVVQVSSS